MMYPHSITLWTALGEVDRKATWKRTFIEECRAEDKSGAFRKVGGDQSADSANVIIPNPADFTLPDVFDGSGWTLREGDRIARGDVQAAEPPSNAWAVQWAEPIYLDEEIHHIEVSAQ